MHLLYCRSICSTGSPQITRPIDECQRIDISRLEGKLTQDHAVALGIHPKKPEVHHIEAKISSSWASLPMRNCSWYTIITPPPGAYLS